jgi:hypothetical protein
MLDSKNRFARYGAAEALGRVGFGNKDAADKLIGMMEHDHDTLFRIYAVNALTSANKRLGLITVAKPAIPVLLKMATEAIADDPRRVLQHDISKALFYSELSGPRRGLIPLYGIEDIDRSLLISAVRHILTNQNGWARSTTTHLIYPLLDDQSLGELWGDIYKATRYIAPSGIMFASEARTDGLTLMSQHHVKEGMYLAAWYTRWQKGHGSPRRLPRALKALEGYGAHAKALIPYLEQHLEYFRGGYEPGTELEPSHPASLIQATIETIKASTAYPELINIADYIDDADIPPKDGP